MSQLPGEIDRRRFLRAMGRLGWHVLSVRGSHFKLVEAASGRALIVSAHGKVRRHAILSTLHLAKISVEEFLAAL